MAKKIVDQIALKEFLTAVLDNEMLIKLTLSRSLEEGQIKTTGKVFIKTNMYYLQLAHHYKDGKILHKNIEKALWSAAVVDTIGQYQQCNLNTDQSNYEIKRAKDGNYVVIYSKNKQKQPLVVSTHNRSKNFIFKEGVYSSFLHRLGIMNEEGQVLKNSYDKFKQINHFLALVEESLDKLVQKDTVHIVDLCCGKAYLSYAVYAYLVEQRGMKVKMIGIDRKPDVIAHCNLVAAQLGYHNMTFIEGDIVAYKIDEPVDMVLSLHACDIATDIVLAKGIEWKARVILSSPCCHHEIASQLTPKQSLMFSKYPIMKQRFSELLTDTLRGEILKLYGYHVDIIEFIESEHTHKNLLIRAYLENIPKTLNTIEKEIGLRCEPYGINPSLPKLLGLDITKKIL